MKAWHITKHGDLNGLQIAELPNPTPGPGQVLVRVRAVSLNYRDLITVEMERPGNLPPPFAPCSDGAGEVVSVGDGVAGLKVGDRVAGLFFQEWQDGPFDLRYHQQSLGGSAPGMLAEYVVLPESGAIRIPDFLTFEEAASLPCAAVTAWQALFSRGHLRAGESVLTLGTGGVSIFALQLAHAAGANVIITSSSDEKLARARELGATGTVNYKTHPDWDKEVWRITGKRGADHVVEVGGSGTMEKSMNSVGASGQVALIGVLTGFGGLNAGLFPLMARNARIDGIYVGSRADFSALLEFMGKHSIRPVIDRVFPFEEGRVAFEHMKSGAHFGKVVIAV